MSTNDKHEILKGLESELASVSVEFDALSKRQSALQKAIAGVRELISLNGGLLPVSEDKPLFSKNAFANLGNLEGAIKYLRLVGKPQTNREVVEALIQGGKKSESKSFSDTVRVTLLREAEKPDGRVCWTGHQWTLPEWGETGEN